MFLFVAADILLNNYGYYKAKDVYLFLSIQNNFADCTVVPRLLRP